jgi:hypothetical protein
MNEFGTDFKIDSQEKKHLKKIIKACAFYLA